MVYRNGDGEGTRIIVQGSWQPRELYMRMQQFGFQVQAVKQQGYQRLVLVFSKLLDSASIQMIRRSLASLENSNENQKTDMPLPALPKDLPSRDHKPSCVRRCVKLRR